MKSKFSLLMASLFLTINTALAFTVPYYNKDSKSYKMEVKANGSTSTISFSASTSSSASVQTSADVIEVKTDCGWVKVKNGQKIVIKNGCITIE